MKLFDFNIGILLESGTVDKLRTEALSIGMLNSKPCEGSSGGDGSGQFEKISLKNILSAFAILLSGIGTDISKHFFCVNVLMCRLHNINLRLLFQFTNNVIIFMP